MPESPKPLRLVIGIAGPMGSGKTTLAKALEKAAYKQGVERALVLPFAQGVKQIAYAMGWDGKKDEHGRRLLQLIGTECGRECIHPDLWTMKWSQEVRAVQQGWLLRSPTLIIADDIRFPNEVNAVHNMGWGGHLIKIKGRGEYSEHGSEKELPDSDFHAIFHNNATPDVLEAFAYGTIEHLLARHR